VLWLKDLKIQWINGTNATDVEPLGEGHDAAVNKVELPAHITLHVTTQAELERPEA
jgi:hypothetical protein